MAEASNSEERSKRRTKGTVEAEKRQFSPFTRRVFVVVAIAILAILLWQIAEVVLLVILGVLAAIFLSVLANKISARTPIPRWGGLIIVGLLPLVVIGGGGWFFQAQVVNQSDQITQQFQETVEGFQEHPIGQRIVEQAPSAEEILNQTPGVFSQITGAASRVFDVLTGILIIVFLAVYLSVKPELYVNGLVQLFPEDQRTGAREALHITGRSLWLWLLAQFAAMIAVGVMAWLGLMLLGVPMAPVLGLIAGILEFIPIVGPVIASIPAILVGLVESPAHALYVLLLFIVIEQVESALVTPLVQEQGPKLPPALTLLATVVFGILFGVLGLIVATPLMVVLFVLTKLLYVEGVLGSATNVPGRPTS